MGRSITTQEKKEKKSACWLDKKIAGNGGLSPGRFVARKSGFEGQPPFFWKRFAR
jgi:hypothetical protein